MKRLLVAIVFCLIVVGSLWSLFKPGLFRVHDYTHNARVAEMARGIKDGQLPVRWSANFGYGFGMPLFQFYAPLPYAMAAVPWLIAENNETAVKSLYIIPTLLILFASYMLAKLWLPRSGALLSAAAIVLAPYRAVNLFVRGAVSEAWGMTFFVVSLLGVAYLIKRKKYGWLILVAGLSGMVLSHNLTAFMAAPFLLLWTIALFLTELRSGQDWRTWFKEQKDLFGKLLGSGLLAVGLSAFYWLPALMEKSASQLDDFILSDYFNFRLHFLYIRQFVTENWKYGGSSWGPTDDISFFLGYGQILALMLSVLAIAYLVINAIRIKKLLPQQAIIGIGWLLATGLALFLSLQRSEWLWNLVPPLEYLQFPWRFLSIAAVFIGLLTGFWTVIVKRTKVRLGLAVILFIALFFNAKYFSPEMMLDQSSKLYDGSPEHIRATVSDILPDYLPEGFKKPDVITAEFASPGDIICSTDCKTDLLVSSSDQVAAVVTSKDGTLVTFHRAYFPGWQAETAGKAVPIIQASNALISVAVPSGTWLVGISLERTQVRLVADLISLFSIICILFLVQKSYRHHEK